MGLLEALNKQKIINSIETAEDKQDSKKDDKKNEKSTDLVAKDPYVAFRDRLQKETVSYVNDNHNTNPLISKEQYVRMAIQNFIISDELAIPKEDQESVIDDVAAEIIGLGPTDKLLRNDDVSEIMVNGPNQVYVEEKGRLHLLIVL